MAKKMKMAFNADPDKQAIEVLFSSKTNKFDHPPSFLNGFPIVQVKETKHLGLSSIQFKFCEAYEFKDYQKNKADCRYNNNDRPSFFLLPSEKEKGRERAGDIGPISNHLLPILNHPITFQENM